MNEKIAVIHRKIKELEEELEEELNRAREKIHYHFVAKKVLFEQQVAEYHRKIRKGVFQFLKDASVLHILTGPVIYGMVAPLAFLDLSATIYQWICFPVYGIKKVPRSDFITLDRRHLVYLNPFEKFNCDYCSYANGLAAYLREIAARTEEYWCPIKHAKRVRQPHSRYHTFLDYGDAEAYRERINKWRKKGE